MSFMLTTRQFRRREKHVTRRKGWLNVKVGEHIMGVVKGQGLKAGEHPVKLGEIVVTGVRREGLVGIFGPGELALEGFPDMNVAEFIDMYCKANGGDADQLCTRIAFDYVGRDAQDRSPAMTPPAPAKE
jgi:hypothetical protein